MKKLISIVLATMLVLMATVPAFAAESLDDFPKSGIYKDFSELGDYSVEPVDYGHNVEKLSLDNDAEKQIKEDYLQKYNENGLSSNYTIDDINLDYYGTLSDGTMLVFAEFNDLRYMAVVECHVIGKYAFYTSYAGKDIKLYKNHKFSRIVNEYTSGNLSDELLDEIADKLCFGVLTKTENNNTQPTTVSSTQSTTKSPATADTATKNNNANGSIPTGQNSILIYTMLAALVSAGAVAILVKRKKS